MKILITGATGLVGKSLTALCREDNIVVNYLTTSKEKIRSENNLQGFYWNPRENFIDENALADVDTIVHLAGASIAQRWTAENRESIFSSRIDTARMLFDTLSRKRKEGHPKTVKQYISASAVGGYPSSYSELYDESFPTYAEGFLGEVVEEWEKVTLEFENLGIKTCRVRTGIILDKNGGALPKMMQPVNYGVGAPLGSGKQWQSWIHTEDMTGVYYHIIKNRLTGVYNGVGPHPVTNKELTKAIGTVLGKPVFLPNVPKFMLKLILGDMGAIVLESQKVSAEKIIDAGYTFKYPALQEALESILTPI